MFAPLLVGLFAKMVLFNLLLDNILDQKGNAPFLALSYFGQDFFGFLIGTERNIFILFHMNHPYTSYTFSLDNAMKTL